VTAPRKPYTTPRLVTYGHVKDIVQGATGNKADAGTTKQTGPPCWIAEALYGVDDARTLVLRAWLQEVRATRRAGWPLVHLYVLVGPAVALAARRLTSVDRILRPLFDRLVTAALDERARALRDERHRRAA
jgi:hypothetical protein